ncbi:MAG: glycoside hydrolase family 4 [Kiritimatiellia bacterium]
MSSPKIVLIGAGSLFFGRKAIWQMVHSPHLREGTLALVDTDAERLDKMKRLAEKVVAHNGVSLKIEASTDRREVLAGADFVVLSFAHRNAHYRGVDCELSAKYGIRMCSGDTIGPGGILRSMRELPEAMRVAEDIRELAPAAWMVNYINPTSVLGIAIKRNFPDLKSFALCDAQHGLKKNFAELAGIIESKDQWTPEHDRDFELLTAGVNHFTWMLKADYRGEDMTPKIIERLEERAAGELAVDEKDPAYKGSKGHLNTAIQLELYRAFGALPTVVGHTKEYVRFWQGHGVMKDAIPPLMLFDTEARVKWTNDVWERVDAYLSGEAPIAEFDTEFGPDPATDIIESMWGGLGKRFFMNTWNNGAVSNMADDAFLELYCELDMDGPRPLPVGDMPRGVRGLSEQVLDTHELTVEGIVKRDRDLLRRAFFTDPLTNSLADTDALMLDLFRKEREVLERNRDYPWLG